MLGVRERRRGVHVATASEDNPAAELRAGENATLRVRLAPSADAPLIYEHGPGDWPDWAALNTTTGALELTAPSARAGDARRVWLSVAMVMLDARAVTGLARRVVRASVTLLPRI